MGLLVKSGQLALSWPHVSTSMTKHVIQNLTHSCLLAERTPFA